MKLLLVFALAGALLLVGCCGSTGSKTSVSELTGNCAYIDVSPLQLTPTANGNFSLSGVELISLQGFSKTDSATSKSYACHVGSKAGENVNHVYCDTYSVTKFSKKTTLPTGQIEETKITIGDVEFAKLGSSYELAKVACSETVDR